MGNLITKKKVSTTSIRIAVNKAFIQFGQTCDINEMNQLNLSPSSDNIAPNIFQNSSMTFSFDCIDNEFNSASFYNFLLPELINLAQTQSASLFGLLDAPPSFANVQVDEDAIRDAVFRSYYNFNDECNILTESTLIDFNIDGTYNKVTETTANQTMNSFGSCQLTQNRQNQTITTYQDVINDATEVTHSWVAWLVIGIVIIIIIAVIIIIIFAIISSSARKSSEPSYEGLGKEPKIIGGEGLNEDSLSNILNNQNTF